MNQIRSGQTAGLDLEREGVWKPDPWQKKNNQNNCTFICNFTQNTQKCIITGKENQQKMFPLREEQEGKKVKPPTSVLLETTWGPLGALLLSCCPQTQHPPRSMPSMEHWQGLKATAFLNLLIHSWYSQNQRKPQVKDHLAPTSAMGRDDIH